MEFKSNGTMVPKWIAVSHVPGLVFLVGWLVIIVEFYDIKPHNDVSACNNGRDI